MMNMVRPFQRKFSSVDWSKLSKKLTDSKAKSALASLQQTYGEVYADANKYLKEPAEIDFEHYKSIIKTKGLVEAFEKDYKALEFEEVDPAMYVAEGAEEAERMVNDAKKEFEFSKERIASLEEMLKVMEETKITETTTVEEMRMMHPDLVAEIDHEIGEYDWSKDTA